MAHIQLNFYSNALKKNANVIVFIPTVSADDYLMGGSVRYGHKGLKYQTLYLLHGSYGDYLDWSRFTGIERYAQDKVLAVVMPSGENSGYVNMAFGEAYETYLTKELPEFMEKMFPVAKKRENTFIGGLSMGGYGAFHCALKCPERYGCAVSLSGALDMQMLQNSRVPHITNMSLNYRKAVYKDFNKIRGSDADIFYLLEEAVKGRKDLPKLYMACGQEDFIFEENENFYNKAEKLSVSVEYIRDHGIHEWDYWDVHIRMALDWLPCKKDLVEE